MKGKTVKTLLLMLLLFTDIGLITIPFLMVKTITEVLIQTNAPLITRINVGETVHTFGLYIELLGLIIFSVLAFWLLGVIK